VVPYSTIIGLEGIALVTHPENPDTSITVEEFLQLLTAENGSTDSLHTKWKDIVFDGAGSANLRYLDSLAGGKKFSEYVFSKNSADSTFDFVSKNKNSIGVVSFGLIADDLDPRAMVNRNKIKILSVSNNNKNYYKPCQRNFVNYMYPFTRRIFMHSRDYDGSLAMGFISFVSAEEGQLILKKAALLPARLYWRDMEAKFEPMNIK
jgi:phosphate transport system substrate-binding protein